MDVLKLNVKCRIAFAEYLESDDQRNLRWKTAQSVFANEISEDEATPIIRQGNFIRRKVMAYNEHLINLDFIDALLENGVDAYQYRLVDIYERAIAVAQRKYAGIYWSMRGDFIEDNSVECNLEAIEELLYEVSQMGASSEDFVIIPNFIQHGVVGAEYVSVLLVKDSATAVMMRLAGFRLSSFKKYVIPEDRNNPFEMAMPIP